MNKSILTIFNIVAFLEGLSYILLLFIAVPIKYMADDAKYVKILGMPHGILFVVYIIIALIIAFKYKLKSKTVFWLIAYSLIPIAAFYAERNLIEKNIRK